VTRVNTKLMNPTRRAGWLLGPVVVSHGPEESGDEALAQARDLATAAMVEVWSCTLDSCTSGNILALAEATGAGLVVLPGSLMDTAEGPRHLRAAMATARPVLLVRASLYGPVITVADAPRAGLGAMAVAADEARRLDCPLLVVHSAEGTVGATKDDLGPVSAMSLRACLGTIRLRWGVTAGTRAIQGPWVSSLSSLARELTARLIVLGAYDGSGTDDVTRTQRMLKMASQAPCSVLLLPQPPEAGPWFAEQPKPSELLDRPRAAANQVIQAPREIQ
jgi:nucleotide-binding universal stress UspA family protein